MIVKLSIIVNMNGFGFFKIFIFMMEIKWMCCCVEFIIRFYKNIIVNCNLFIIYKVIIGVYIDIFF